MAVYTSVDPAEAARLFEQLGLGPLSELQGIRSGIENTNYYAATSRGQWVLTLFERLTHDELPYYLRLMQHLAAHGIPVPAPQADAAGGLLHELAGKPAAVVTRLPGSHRLIPQLTHVEQLGAMLARLHLAAADFEMQQAHLRGLAWWLEVAPQVLPHVSAAQATLLRDELAFQQQALNSAAGLSLPRGAIHADLFRDNVMFDDTAGDDRLCGLFDFYFAGTEWLLFDVAVCLNDWCCEGAGGELIDSRAAAFVAAYQTFRPFTSLWDWHLPRSAALLQPKDPGQFERVLRSRIDNPWHPPR
jgi:homoserine kinase type II